MAPIEVLSSEEDDINPVDENELTRWSQAACIATPKLLNVQLPVESQFDVLLSRDAPQVPSKLSFGMLPYPTKETRDLFFGSNVLLKAKQDGLQSLAVGDHRLPLGSKKVWTYVDNAKEARGRIRNALAWTNNVEKKHAVDSSHVGKARRALSNLPWHELAGVGKGLGHKRLVKLLSDEWIGETLVNFLIGGIVHFQKSEREGTVYGFIPSDCITYATYCFRNARNRMDVQATLERFQFESWQADLAVRKYVDIASTGHFIKAHPNSVWFFPICDENHWYLVKINVKLKKWTIYNSLSSRKLTRPVLKALAALFQVLGLDMNVDQPILATTPQQPDSFSCGPAIVNVVERLVLHEKAFDPSQAAVPSTSSRTSSRSRS